MLYRETQYEEDKMKQDEVTETQHIGVYYFAPPCSEELSSEASREVSQQRDSDQQGSRLRAAARVSMNVFFRLERFKDSRSKECSRY